MYSEKRCEIVSARPTGDGRYRVQTECGLVRVVRSPRFLHTCRSTTSPAHRPTVWRRLAWLRPKPGNVLKTLILYATGGKVKHGVQCEAFRRRMNAWGWRGCWKHRGEILRRIKEQATQHGYRANNTALATSLACRLARAVVRKIFARPSTAQNTPKDFTI